MASPVPDARIYGDFAGLDALKNSARHNDAGAVRQVARQFESLFARMMLKSMRAAIGRDPIFGSDQADMYQGMFDDQLSLDLTRGRGLGLADMLVRQLQRLGAGSASPAGASGAAAGASVPTGTGAAGTSAGGTAAAKGTAQSGAASAATQAGFVRELWPDAQRAARELGVDPRGLIAQAALESNWGRSVPADEAGVSSHNLFGIKASGNWKGPTASAVTQEYAGGMAQLTSARFRMYTSRAHGLQDYVAVLSGPRYAAARNTGSDIGAFASALQQGGYATDPDYARKISAIARSLPGTDTSDLASAAATSGGLKLAGLVPITDDTSALL